MDHHHPVSNAFERKDAEGYTFSFCKANQSPPKFYENKIGKIWGKKGFTLWISDYYVC